MKPRGSGESEVKLKREEEGSFAKCKAECTVHQWREAWMETFASAAVHTIMHAGETPEVTTGAQ